MIKTYQDFLTAFSRDLLESGPKKRDRKAEFLKLYQAKKRQFTGTLHLDPRNGDLYFIAKIPSSSMTIERLTFDVVLQLRYDVRKFKGPKAVSMKQAEVRVFTNSPGFVFQDAYVYNSHGLIIPVLKRKLGTKALLEKPTHTNPNLEIRYNSVLVNAFYYLEDLITNQYGNSWEYEKLHQRARNSKIDLKLLPAKVDGFRMKYREYTTTKKTDKTKKKEKQARDQRRKDFIDGILRPITSIFGGGSKPPQKKPRSTKATKSATRPGLKSNQRKTKPTK